MGYSSKANKNSTSSPTSSFSSTSSNDVEHGDSSRSPPKNKIALYLSGQAFQIGPRIIPLADNLKSQAIYQGDDHGAAILERQIAVEKNGIQYRTCSWQKTAALMFSQCISFDIMIFPLAYATLGLVSGIMITFLVAGINCYTALVLWEFCLRHPDARDVCEIVRMLFWGKEWAWAVTAAMLILNNTFIQGTHIQLGAQYINTVTEHMSVGGCRTVQFSLVTVFASWALSLPRTFNILSKLALISAFSTFISVVIGTVFAGVEGKPAGYDPVGKGEPMVSAWPLPGTTFVSGLSMILNISYTFFAQSTVPSFVAEMRDPRCAGTNERCKEFPKSLWACTIASTATFCIVGGAIYGFTGNQYVMSPAYGSLRGTFKIISFSFLVPTILFLGCIYSSVTARLIFFRVFHNTKHEKDNTFIGWASWAGILFISWSAAFLVSQAIPFFSSLISVTSAIFTSYFGVTIWNIAFFRMRNVDRRSGTLVHDRKSSIMQHGLNIFVIAFGLFWVCAGTYASVQEIINSFKAGVVKSVFTCESNGL